MSLVEQVFSPRNLAAIRKIDPSILDRAEVQLRVDVHVKRCHRCRRGVVGCPVAKRIAGK